MEGWGLLIVTLLVLFVIFSAVGILFLYCLGRLLRMIGKAGQRPRSTRRRGG